MISLLRSKSGRLFRRENRPTIETDHFVLVLVDQLARPFHLCSKFVKPFIYYCYYYFLGTWLACDHAFFFSGECEVGGRGREGTWLETWEIHNYSHDYSLNGIHVVFAKHSRQLLVYSLVQSRKRRFQKKKRKGKKCPSKGSTGNPSLVWELHVSHCCECHIYSQKLVPK